ncbi:MAG: hypothetical protein KDC12_10870 [Flavobacteriales bacterium]|nr:hypothetical protein [Flavobacteriales bacterium]
MNKSFIYVRTTPDGGKSVIKLDAKVPLQDFAQEFIRQTGGIIDVKHCVLLLLTGRNNDIENVLSDEKFQYDVAQKSSDKLEVFWGVPSRSPIKIEGGALYQASHVLYGGEVLDVWCNFRDYISQNLDHSERSDFEKIGLEEVIIYFDIVVNRRDDRLNIENAFVMVCDDQLFPNNPSTVRDNLLRLIEHSVEYQDIADAEKFNEFAKILAPAFMRAFRLLF